MRLMVGRCACDTAIIKDLYKVKVNHVVKDCVKCSTSGVVMSVEGESASPEMAGVCVCVS